MPREFIASDGRIFFRTKLLAFEQAQRFALCLQANTTRFCDVDFLLSEKAMGECAYFVQFRPVNEDRQWEQIERQQSARLFRALEEGACYVFALDIDGPRPFYWCFNPKSGETYQTDSGSCTCPDFHYRCKKLEYAALYCKHIHALLHAFEIGELMRLSEVYDTPAWLARHPLLPVHRYPGDFADPFTVSDPFAEEVPL